MKRTHSFSTLFGSQLLLYVCTPCKSGLYVAGHLQACGKQIWPGELIGSAQGRKPWVFTPRRMTGLHGPNFYRCPEAPAASWR